MWFVGPVNCTQILKDEKGLRRFRPPHPPGDVRGRPEWPLVFSLEQGNEALVFRGQEQGRWACSLPPKCPRLPGQNSALLQKATGRGQAGFALGVKFLLNEVQFLLNSQPRPQALLIKMITSTQVPGSL